MIVTDKIAVVRSMRWTYPDANWGLVPTMGYLHEGHLSLVRRACAENDRILVTIYVNPTQFAPGEDLDAYPRDIDRDLGLLDELGVDLVFMPDDLTMFPEGFQTKVTVGNVTRILEGSSRPSHFQGVTTIVTKLFNIAQPTRAYFGQKDAQQAIIIRQLINDLNVNLELVICPIVREPDGLAMSSRNVRLSSDQRTAATVLFKALHSASSALEGGETDGAVLRRIMAHMIQKESLARIDYVSVANPLTLEKIITVKGQVLLSMAVFFGDVRLIDNALIN
jgi:pantoate--beta-alanine ligase